MRQRRACCLRTSRASARRERRAGRNDRARPAPAPAVRSAGVGPEPLNQIAQIFPDALDQRDWPRLAMVVEHVVRIGHDDFVQRVT